MTKKREVVCYGCGIIRIAEIDNDQTEKEGHVTARHTCQACSCPFVETKEQALKE